MKAGLFFGSFNPVHIGHLIIASTMAENADLDQVWFVVSPQNPFKNKKNLLHEFDRLYMVRQAIADNPRFNATDIEFNMPKPSYTIDTLAWLSDKYPQNQFRLIVGEDNLHSFYRWKNHEQILQRFGLLVYPRPHAKPSTVLQHENVRMVEAPQVDISATFIRKAIQNGRSIKYLVPEEVEAYINLKRFYRD